MSVLVEALSLVIPRINLDISYPGGADAFLEAMCAPECPSRHVCMDDALVSVSFLDPDGALAVVSPLVDLGFVELDEQRFRDFALIDQHLGPTMPCDWIEWKRHRDGFTYAWPAGAEPGDMATPAGWTPEQSRRLTRTDLRDEPGRMLKLAEEGDVETWLDFQTGRITVGMKRLAECGSGTAAAAGHDGETREVPLARRKQKAQENEGGGGLLSIVMRTFEDVEFPYTRYDQDSLGGRLRADKASYELFVTVDDARETAAFYLLFATRAPEARRAAVAEVCIRANWNIVLGSLDLDLDSGDVRYRCCIDVEDGVLTPTMVNNIVMAGAWTLDNYHDALMRAMIGDADVAPGSGELPE